MQPDRKNRPPTAQTSGKDTDRPLSSWLELARRSYESSTGYFDSNYRKQWDDSLRSFNNQHPTDSKYNQPSYDKRSKIYRPRIRAVIRKNEAAGAAAFFSNMDVVSITAQDPTSKVENASADVMKELLQYRLTKSIPWYQIVLGGLQDAQTTGAAVAHVYWDYEESDDAVEISIQPASMAEALPATSEEELDSEYPSQSGQSLPDGSMVAQEGGGIEIAGAPMVAETKVAAVKKPKPIKDKPCVELLPIENVRFDPAASWTDPVGTSPYWIHLMPMYVLDVKENMEKGIWISHGDDVIGNALQPSPDTTRLARNKGQQDPLDGDSQSIGDYQTVWVHRHIHRRNGTEWEFYTLGTVAMLTEPTPLKDKVFHGKRPYVVGCCILETHKVIPSSVPTLGRGLQDEINEVANQRIDNVKFVLNKKWLVKRGKEADVQGLVRNVPGGVVMLDDPINDVRELTWPDVTASSFQEHQGLNMELDELLGNFNPAALMSQGGAGNSPAKNMAMLSNSQGTLVEYLLRTYVETFVQPILRHMVMLEQEYETDQVVMKIAGKRAEMFQKYGIDEVTDELLAQELTLSVNVGMGATDPMQKLQKFLTGITTYTQMLANPTPGINMQEVGKEIFGHLGYADGSRFFTQDNPQVAALEKKVQEVTQMAQQLQGKLKDKTEMNQVKLKIATDKNATELQKAKISEEAANKRALATHFSALTQHQDKLSHEKEMKHKEKMAATQAAKPAPAPKPAAPPKPADIHVHLPAPPQPQVIIHHPKKTKSTVHRDPKTGDMLGTETEYEA